MSNVIFNEESKNLNVNLSKIDGVITKYDDQVKKNDEEIKELGHEMSPRKTELTRENNKLYDKIHDAKTIKKSPYYAHMLLSSDNKNTEMFIGKKSFSDVKNKQVVYDWRSKVANLLKSNQFTQKINGIKYTVMYKRDIDIDDEELKNVFENYRNPNFNAAEDINEPSSSIINKTTVDKFLLEILRRKRNNNKIVDIIETIQTKQDEIIRTQLNTNMLVQGVAGSGKTAIIMHRLSYLLYNNRDINPNKFLFITPSDTFINKLDDLSKELEIDKIDMIPMNDYFDSIFNKIFIDKYINGFTCPPLIKIDNKDELNNLKNLIKNKMDNDYKYSLDYINSVVNINKDKYVFDSIYKYNDLINVLKKHKDSINLNNSNVIISVFFEKVLKNINNYIICKINENRKIDYIQLDDKIKVLINNLNSKINDKIVSFEPVIMTKDKKEKRIKELNNIIDNFYEKLYLYFDIKNESEVKEFVENIDLILQSYKDKYYDLKQKLDDKNNNLNKTKFTTFDVLQEMSNETSKLEKEIDDYYIIIQNIRGLIKDGIKDLFEYQKEYNLLVLNENFKPVNYFDNKKLIDNFIDTIKYLYDNDYDLTINDKNNIIKILYLIYDNIGNITHNYNFELINKLKNINTSNLKNDVAQIDYQMNLMQERMSPKYLIDCFKEIIMDKDNDHKRITMIDSQRRKILLELFVMYKYSISKKYSYIYVDEVQDYSIDDLNLLMKLDSNCVYNFYGDKDQKLIENDDPVVWDYFKGKYGFKYHELNENYRNTTNIVEYCNSNLNTKMNPIGNDGNNVIKKEFVSYNEIIKQYNNFEHCAIIGDEKDLRLFRSLNIECYTVNEAKGLEFSNIIVLDNPEWNNNYKYVAYTRSLNNLIIYSKMPNLLDSIKKIEINEIDLSKTYFIDVINKNKYNVKQEAKNMINNMDEFIKAYPKADVVNYDIADFCGCGRNYRTKIDSLEDFWSDKNGNYITYPRIQKYLVAKLNSSYKLIIIHNKKVYELIQKEEGIYKIYREIKNINFDISNDNKFKIANNHGKNKEKESNDPVDIKVDIWTIEE